jgi:prepilin-type N-terminal cleavage/methylation domain-containing protein
MGLPALKSNGFTLIEMMISMLIIMVSMLALGTMMEVTMDTNMTNEMRSVAVRLTNQTAEALLAIPTTPESAVDPLLTASTTTYTRIAGNSHQDSVGLPKIQQSIRGTTKTFNIQWAVADATPTMKQIQITVSYQYKGKTLTNSALVYKHSAGI